MNADELFLKAAEEGEMDTLKSLLESKVDMNLPNKYGFTALMVASMNNHPECVKLLLAAQADVNLQNEDDGTALMYASGHNHPECVKLLLAAQADKKLQNFFGWTALMCASGNNSHECVKLLIAAQVDVNFEDMHGHTALTCAYPECVKMLKDGLTNEQHTNALSHLECARLGLRNLIVPPITNHLLSLMIEQRRVIPFPVDGGHVALWDTISEYVSHV